MKYMDQLSCFIRKKVFCSYSPEPLFFFFFFCLVKNRVLGFLHQTGKSLTLSRLLNQILLDSVSRYIVLEIYRLFYIMLFGYMAQIMCLF